MFGRPKKKLGVGKPMSGDESVAVKKAMAKKYPQMSGANWGKPVKRETAMGRIKKSADERQKSMEEALTPDEIARYKVRAKYRDMKK